MGWLDEVARALVAEPIRRRSVTPLQRRAAVLVPLFVNGGALWVLLTRRAPGLPRHGGAVAFPGGVVDEADDDEVATALREAEEELGLGADRVVVLGQLSDVVTTSGFVASPVVGAIPWPTELRLEAAEVAHVLPVPLAALLAPTAIEWIEEEGAEGLERAPVLHLGSCRIGGATARVLLELVARLKGALAAVGDEARPR